MTPEIPRRTVLGGIVSSTTALAGCVGSLGQGMVSPSGGPFAALTVRKQSLVIELADGASLDRVNVISPNGEQFASQPVATGAEQVSIHLGVEYQPGEHRIVAVKDDTQAGETTLTIEPNLRIVEVGIGMNHMDEMPDTLGTTQDVEAFVRVENTGNGPTAISKLLFLGNIPNPTIELQNSSKSGILDPEEGAGSLERVPFVKDSLETLYTNTLPFSFEGEGVDCGTEKKSGTFRVILRSSTSMTLEKQYSIQYAAAESYNECKMTIIAR